MISPEQTCLRRLIAGAALALGLAATAHAAGVYSLADDFSTKGGNPNGVWAYGSGKAGASFTPFRNALSGGFTNDPRFVFWQSSNPQYGVPIVGKNTDSTPINASTVVVPAGAVIVHPGVDSDVIVRWRAPKAGQYRYTGRFELLDVSPSGVIGEVFKNHTRVYKGVLTGPGANHSTSAPGQSETFANTVTLEAGDTLSFAVNNDGSVFYDSTGLSVTITAAP